MIRSWFKGADTYAVSKYLEDKYFKLLSDYTAGGEKEHYLRHIYKSIHAGNEFLSRLYRTHLFLRRPEARHIAEYGQSMINHYLSAASYAHKFKYTRFKLVPKLHLVWHLVAYLRESSATKTWCVSPVAFSCQMDEDLVGRVSTTSRSCSIRTVHVSTIRKYLVQVNLSLKGNKKVRKKRKQKSSAAR